jgi:hypothetical protein
LNRLLNAEVELCPDVPHPPSSTIRYPLGIISPIIKLSRRYSTSAIASASISLLNVLKSTSSLGIIILEPTLGTCISRTHALFSFNHNQPLSSGEIYTPTDIRVADDVDYPEGYLHFAE